MTRIVRFCRGEGGCVVYFWYGNGPGPCAKRHGDRHTPCAPALEIERIPNTEISVSHRIPSFPGGGGGSHLSGGCIMCVSPPAASFVDFWAVDCAGFEKCNSGFALFLDITSSQEHSVVLIRKLVVVVQLVWHCSGVTGRVSSIPGACILPHVRGFIMEVICNNLG